MNNLSSQLITLFGKITKTSSNFLRIRPVLDMIYGIIDSMLFFILRYLKKCENHNTLICKLKKYWIVIINNVVN